jgi:hypothetical protein
MAFAAPETAANDRAGPTANMTGPAMHSDEYGRSTELRARLALAQTIQPSSRGQCFRNAKAKTNSFPLSFADIAALPEWLSWSQNDRDKLALAAAILYHRPAIDRELSGTKLAALADAVGHSFFGHLCSEECGENFKIGFLSDQFPRPEDLPAIGERMLGSSLPKAFSQTFPAAIGDEQARKLVAFAAALISRSDAEMQAA